MSPAFPIRQSSDDLKKNSAMVMRWKLSLPGLNSLGDPAFSRRAFNFFCRPFRIFVFMTALLLLIVFSSTTYYSQFSNPASRCWNSVAALPPHRVESENVTATHAACVVIVIGDDSASPTFSALPFSVLRRIFREVLNVRGIEGEVGLVEPDLQNVLVMVDYTSFVCRMVRDALGPAAKCQSFQNELNARHQVSCGTLVVGQTRKYVQQACAEWTDRFLYETLKIVDLDSPDPAYQPPVLPSWRPTIVTAFSRNHFKYGLLLLRSVGKAASDPIVSSKYQVSVVVWTMDDFNEVEQKYLDCVLQEMQDLGVEAEARRYPFEIYPSWMRLNASLIANHDGGKGEYAWKAIMANTVIRERGFILWMDAGGRIITSKGLTDSLDYVKKIGFGGHTSQDDVKTWTHPEQLKYFRADSLFVKKQQNCDASRFGFTLDIYESMFRPWYECSTTRQCIAPDGTDRFNHRQDQAALTVLSILTGHRCVGLSDQLIRHTDNYGFDFYGGVDKTKCYEDPINL